MADVVLLTESCVCESHPKVHWFTDPQRVLNPQRAMNKGSSM
jgi:hypothetical protein